MNIFSIRWDAWKRARDEKKRYPGFWKIEKRFRSSYRFCNPYRVSRQYLEALGEEDVHKYGEIPLLALDQIGKALDLGPDDHVVDMGCGRGRGVFFLNERFGCRATGVEQVPLFVKKARRIQPGLHVDFRLENMLKTNLNGVSAVYLYGSCLDDREIQVLQRLFSKQPLKLATVSFAFEAFEVDQVIELDLPWGRAECFIQATT